MKFRRLWSMICAEITQIKRNKKRGKHGIMRRSTIVKSEIIDMLAAEQPQFTHSDVELAVNSIIDCLANALIRGERIEIRGFGSFSLHHRASRVGRNPKTGVAVHVEEKYVPHFKPGKELRARVDYSADERPDLVIASPD